jgi:15-cis-phytoene synthase
MAGALPFADQVRGHDLARYLSALYAPEAKRADLFALYAFDAEMQRIPYLVKESGMGEIRLQWWREVLDGQRDGEASGNPLASAILDVLRRHELPFSAFDRYFDAASFAFYHDPFSDRHAFEAWAGATHSAIMQMAALILDPEAAKLAAESSGHAGVVYAVADVLRHLPRTRSRGQCYVPEDILTACSLTRETFVHGGTDDALKRATDAFAALGQEHMAKFEAARRSLPALVKPATLPAFAAAKVLAKSVSPALKPAVQGVSLTALPTFWTIFRAASR